MIWFTLTETDTKTSDTYDGKRYHDIQEELVPRRYTHDKKILLSHTLQNT